jgi:hypothetical protein
MIGDFGTAQKPLPESAKARPEMAQDDSGFFGKRPGQREV